MEKLRGTKKKNKLRVRQVGWGAKGGGGEKQKTGPRGGERESGTVTRDRGWYVEVLSPPLERRELGRAIGRHHFIHVGIAERGPAVRRACRGPRGISRVLVASRHFFFFPPLSLARWKKKKKSTPVVVCCRTRKDA